MTAMSPERAGIDFAVALREERCAGRCGGRWGGAGRCPELERREEARPDRLECPECVQARAAKDLGPLMLPVPTKHELVAALVFTPDDPLWEDRVLHAKLYPARVRRV
ncbi:hypothetical protein VM98_26320 [Streptomyces rubellomurinus subsp. indigoferus]|nr:hypothetical protein VM98_26320 [Streptomyces rubellomurinus subsp. indigoferus]